MMTLESLTIENFGPYKGEQTIKFSSEDGVTIIYGENGRGKTSLLNSIRFALFGKVIGRGSFEQSLALVGNWESAREGVHGFKVTLTFSHEGKRYDLTRQYVPRGSVSSPLNEHDFNQEVYLKRDGSVLTPEERDRELALIMPEQVSRFFLFDGELLQEYEELLRNESDMGHKIKEAIERILGLPVLTNARTDLEQLLSKAQYAESKELQKNQQTATLGTLLETNQTNLQHSISNLQDLQNKMRLALEEKSRLEEKLQQTERDRNLILERNDLVERNKVLDERKKEKEQELKDIVSNSWKGMLNETLSTRLELIDQEITNLEIERAKKLAIFESFKAIESAINTGECPTCNQSLTSSSLVVLQQRLMDNSSIEFGDDSERLQELVQKKASLRKLIEPNVKENVVLLEDAISEYTVDLADNESRIQEIMGILTGANEKETIEIKNNYDAVIRSITIIDTGITAEKTKIEQVRLSISKLQDQLSKLTVGDLSEEQKRRDVYSKLVELFTVAKDNYRDKLREKVEDEASNLFVQLTNEPDYERLDINENYGLTIIHKDGNSIPVRSAGVEHTVALSLMGALQKSAPLQGPIIMDSPFGRLDPVHKENITRALPTMAHQVVLLVYSDELNKEMARDILLGKLRSEFKLVRRSARHTIIEGMGE